MAPLQGRHLSQEEPDHVAVESKLNKKDAGSREGTGAGYKERWPSRPNKYLREEPNRR